VSHLITYCIQAATVLTVGLLAPRLLRLRSPRICMRYWQLLLLVVILLPAIQPWRDNITGFVSVETVGVAVADTVTNTLPRSAAWPILEWTLVVLAAVAVLRIAWLAMGLAMLRHHRLTADEIDRMPAAIDALQSRLRTRARFMVSQRVPIPVTFGWYRPTVLVPRGFRDLPDAQQATIACHELLHVRRRDWPAIVLEQLLRAVLWFHPAVSILLRRVGLCREQLIDAEVVRITGTRRPYLDALWNMARSGGPLISVPALPLLNRSELVERVALLAEEARMSKTRVVLSTAVVVAVVALAGGVAAATFPFVKADEPPMAVESKTTDPKSAERSAEQAKLDLRKRAVRYEVNGEVTEPKIIHKVNPKYPEEARKTGQQGVVVCETVIDAKGEVADIKILRTDHEILVPSTVEAIKQWKFKPSTLDGEPVDVIYILTVQYRLDVGEKKAAEKEPENEK
jgi:TonB family protein